MNHAPHAGRVHTPFYSKVAYALAFALAAAISGCADDPVATAPPSTPDHPGGPLFEIAYDCPGGSCTPADGDQMMYIWAILSYYNNWNDARCASLAETALEQYTEVVGSPYKDFGAYDVDKRIMYIHHDLWDPGWEPDMFLTAMHEGAHAQNIGIIDDGEAEVEAYRCYQWAG